MTSPLSLWPARERRQRIMTLSLPIIGGMVSQNVLNLVDTFFVGKLGNAALAAVGQGSFANFMAMSFFMGMSSGVQAMAARRKGEGRLDETAIPLNGGLLLSAALGLPVTVALWIAAPYIFPHLTDDPEVARLGGTFFQLRLLSVVAVGMNFSFRGYVNAVDRPGRYMRTLVVMHVVNIFANWVLVFGKLGMPALGVAGSAIGTTLATWIGTIYYAYTEWEDARREGLLRELPSPDTMRSMLRLALPAGIERLFFSTSMTVLFWIIGQIGTKEQAAANVLLNVALVAILPGVGFGLSAGTLAGQALGRGDPEDAKRWGWEVSALGMAVVGSVALVVVLIPEPLLRMFIHDPQTLAIAAPAARIMAAAAIIDTVNMVLSNALLGVGAARTVMIVSIAMQWLLLLPTAYLAGPVLGGGLVAVWMVQALHRCLQAGVIATLWHRGKWAHIRV